MKDILDFIRDSINAGKDRLKNPLIMYYLLFAALIHWKAVSLFIFSSESMEKRIYRIERLYRDWNQWDYVLQSILILIFVLIINIGLPHLMLFFEKHTSEPNKKRKGILYDGYNVDRSEDIKKSRHEFEKSKIVSGNVEQDDFNKELKLLQDTIEENRVRHQEAITVMKKTQDSEMKALKTSYENSLNRLKLNQVSDKVQTQISYNEFPNISNLAFGILNSDEGFKGRVINILKFIHESDGISNFKESYIQSNLDSISYLLNNKIIEEVYDYQNNKNYFLTFTGQGIIQILISQGAI